MQPVLDSLDHLVLTVDDIAATCAFYRDVLGMDVEEFDAADGSTRTALRFGAMKINLHRHGAEFRPHAKVPAPGTADICFLTGTPLEAWILHFDTQGVELEEGPVTRSGAQGPLQSLYLRDPDGNLLEVSVQMSTG